MSYLSFEKKQLINLNFSMSKEILRSNRAGSYASTSITYCNTRKYHGLLICPMEQLDNENHVLLSALDETVIQHDQEFHIGSRRYHGEYHPLGHKYIRDFQAEPIPTHYYRVGGVVLKKEFLLVEEDERILLRYTLEEATSDTRLKFQPFLAFRQVHKLCKANLDVTTRFEDVENGIRTKMYSSYPFLYMQLSKKPNYTHAPDWYYNIEYTEEKRRGYDCHEDLFSNGFFEVPIKKGESIVFSAGLSPISTASLKRKFTSEIKKRIPRTNFENCLENSAQQFFVKKGKKMEVIAGFPWFGAWGRDTFIALPGLSLSRGDDKSCKAVLDSMSTNLRGALFPNMGMDSGADVNSVDAPLWYFWAIQQYVKHVGSFAGIWQDYGKKMVQILEGYKNGTNYGIKMHDNGLIYAGVHGKALTWMDAIAEGKPVTPRQGYNVEINALWYNAIKFALEVAAKSRNNEFIDTWQDMPEKIKNSFNDMFWSEEKGYLADYATEDSKNWDIRPNQVIATSLEHSPVTKAQSNSILQIVKKHLLTPKGLRTLSPNHPDYQGRYAGNQPERDRAYHQGTVWPWLLGHYAEGLLRVHGNAKVASVERMYHNFEEDMLEVGIGTISEIYDGDPPHEPKGAISQAWSVSEVLRIRQLIKKYSE